MIATMIAFLGRIVLIGALTLAPVIAGTGMAARPGDPLTAFGAASLGDALTEIGAAFAAAGHAEPRFAFAASSTLARQVQAGAPADIIALASRGVGVSVRPVSCSTMPSPV